MSQQEQTERENDLIDAINADLDAVEFALNDNKEDA